MQTILGANGIIATELAKALPDYTNEPLRLVSRHPKKVNATDETMAADLLNREQVFNAVEGSSIVYLTAGLPYKVKVWQDQWPVLIDNVIEACKKTNAKLVFFSNVYSLGLVKGWMTEETPMRPSSKKGAVRKTVEERILQEIASGALSAIIARAPDFYGPNTPLSVIDMMAVQNIKKNKRPQWLVNAAQKHSFIFTPDAGRATAMLGNTPSAYNQLWNLPTDRNALTGNEMVSLITTAMGRGNEVTVLPKWMIRLAGLFNESIRGSVEMLYQFEYPYLFDSSKFEKAFNFVPTSYRQGLLQMVQSM